MRFTVLISWVLLVLVAVASPAHAEGATPASNGLLPTLTVDNLVAGESATITVGNLPDSSIGLPVILTYSTAYGGTDLSSFLGPGAVLVPDVVFQPGTFPPVLPARLIPGGAPTRQASAPVARALAGRTFYLQALVQDPQAQGGYALSCGVELTVVDPDDAILSVVVTPPVASVEVGQAVVLTAEIRDGHGNLVPALGVSDIQFAASPGSGSFFFPNLSAGRVSVLYISANTAEESTVVATEQVSGSFFQGISTVRSVAGAPSGAVTLGATPPTAPADGAQVVRITSGPVRDRFGNLVSDGRRISVTTTLGRLLGTDADGSQPGFQVTTTSGTFFVDLQAPGTAGTAHLQAISVEGSAFGSLDVVFTPGAPTIGQVVLTPEQTTLAAGEAVVLTAELRTTTGAPVAATSVSDVRLEITQGTGSLSSLSLIAGSVRVTYQAATTVEAATVRATEQVSGQGHDDTSLVTSIPGSPGGAFAFQASPDQILADGIETATLTSGPVTDAFGNVVPDGTLITVTTTRGTLISPDASLALPGLQRTTLAGAFNVVLRSSTTPGTATVTANSNQGTASGSDDVVFLDPGPDVASVVLTPGNLTADAGSQVVFEAQLLDSQGALVPATSVADVVFSRSPGTGTISSRSLVAGRVRVTYFVATTVESARVAAVEQVSGDHNSDTSWVYGEAGPPSGAFSFQASPEQILADGVESATLTSGPVTDAYGNVVPDGTLVTLTTTLGTLISADASGAIPGLQRTTLAGTFNVVLRSSTTPGTATVNGFSREGSASASEDVVFLDPGPDVASVILTPGNLTAEAGSQVVFEARLLDSQGAPVPATSTSDVLFSRSPGTGTFSSKSLVAGRVRVTYFVAAGVEDARVTAAEVVSGDGHGDATWVYGRAGMPSGPVGLVAAPDEIPADGMSVSSVSAYAITDAFGNVIEDGELFTVTTTLGAIVTTDLDVTRSGIQVTSAQGTIAFEVLSPSAPGAADVTASSVRGAASGDEVVIFTELPGGGGYNLVMSGTLPSPRSLMALAVDQATGKAFCLGGTGESLPREILEIDPLQPFGSLIATLEDVPAQTRYGAPAVQDPITGIVYVVGGRRNAIFNHTDVLTYDPRLPAGQRLGSLSADPLPFAVKEASGVWDPIRSKGYIFEGSSGSLQVLELDVSSQPGSRLRELADSMSGFYTRTSTVWDTGRGKAYIFGGSEGATTRDAILSYDPSLPEGSRFATLVDVLPTARANTSATWDPVRGQAYIIGGSNASGTLAEVVRFNPSLSAGSRVSVVASLPLGLANAAVFGNHGTDRVFVIGGHAGNEGFSDRIIFFDPTTLATGLVNRLTLPTALASASANPATGKAHVFGGRSRTGFHDRIWVLDASLGAGNQVRLISDRLPGARFSTCSVFVPAEGAHYVFGGQTSVVTATDEILRFNPSSPPGSRVTISVDTLPRSVYNSAAVWDTISGVAWIFDATTSSTPLGVIRFNPFGSPGSRVSEISDTLPGRLNVSAVWDPLRRCAWIFGGSNASGPMDAIVRFDPLAPAGSRFVVQPDVLLSPRTATSAAWDSILGRAYIFGGTNGASLADVLVFDPALTPGTRVSLAGSMLFPVAFTASVFDPILGRAIATGGFDDEGDYREDIAVLSPR